MKKLLTGTVGAVIAVSSMVAIPIDVLNPFIVEEAKAHEIPTEIGAVQNVVAVATDIQAAKITWDKIPAATRYRVQVFILDETGKFVKDGAVRTTISPKYEPRTLKPNETYKFEIIPFSTISKKYLPDKSAISNVITLKTSSSGEENGTEEVTNAVTNIQVVSEGKSARVTWKAVSGATRYRVQMLEKDDSGNWITSGGVRTATSPTFKSNTLKENKVYKFEITPYVSNKYMEDKAATSNEFQLSNKEGTDENSNEEGNENVPKIGNIQVSEEGNYAQVTWDEVEGSTRYRVQMFEKDDTGSWVKNGGFRTVTKSTYKSNALKEAKTYKFEVTPYVSNKYVTSSTGVSAEFRLTSSGNESATGNVTNVKVIKKNSSTSVTVSWDELEGSTKYRVHRYEQNEAGGFVLTGDIRTVMKNSMDMSSLKRGTTYRFEVIPYISNKYETDRKGLSNLYTVPFTDTDPTLPSEIIKNAKVILDGQNTTLTWDNFKDASYYEVKLFEKNATNQFEEVLNGGTTTSSTSYTRTLAAGKTYQFRITPYVQGIGFLTESGTTTKEIKIKEQPEAVTPIKNLKATLLNKKVTLSWDATPNAKRYQVYTFTFNKTINQYEKQKTPRTTTVPSLTTPTLKVGEKYKFEVVPYVGTEYVQNASSISEEIIVTQE